MHDQKDLFGDIPLPQPPPPKAFDGSTYDYDRDYERLDSQLGRVWRFIQDGKPHTLEEIADAVGGSQAAVSARLRDYRKKKYGGWDIERRHLGRGLWDYRFTGLKASR